ncbi:MerR family transcriptional regulator [Streptomyces sp. CC228A]|uniref:MerR family transcriptional regulator n=1 Tax=Streptomyces sp. CC228A TaxID=2898186 RepID=UPI0027E47B2C|nr:MerR family transcriptional regulator [Streptomyces sp. CC228A]
MQNDDDTLLSIGAFARRARLSPKALRLYDRQGLLPPDRVDPVTGYRSYREGRLRTARLIARLRTLDMPLTVIADVLAAPGPEAADAVARYWRGVEQRVAAQRALAAHLCGELARGQGSRDAHQIPGTYAPDPADGSQRPYGAFAIKQRAVPGQTVLTELRHAQPEDLPVWIPAATARLEEAAQACGGVVAAPFVVYHGEVSEDSDGPVEVCLPVAPSRAADAPAAARTEPAHQQAYTTLTRAQAGYPQILSAYDAVYRWIAANGQRESGPAREVYFGHWAQAAPDEQVCDLAVPLAAPGRQSL